MKTYYKGSANRIFKHTLQDNGIVEVEMCWGKSGRWERGDNFRPKNFKHERDFYKLKEITEDEAFLEMI